MKPVAFLKDEASHREVLVSVAKNCMCKYTASLHPKNVLVLDESQDEWSDAMPNDLVFSVYINQSTEKTSQLKQDQNGQLPVMDNSFDMVLSHMAMHKRHVGETFCEIARVLKPGGVFLIYDVASRVNETVPYEDAIALRLDDILSAVPASFLVYEMHVLGMDYVNSPDYTGVLLVLRKRIDGD